MNTKQILFSILILLIYATQMQSQSLTPSVISSAGENFKKGSVDLTFTLGETMVTTFTSGDIQLTQGFNQPYSTPTNIKVERKSNEVNLFPNPFEDLVTVSSEDMLIKDVTVFNMKGEAVYFTNSNFDIPKNTIELNLNELPSGVYFLNVKSIKDTNTTLKIIKK